MAFATKTMATLILVVLASICGLTAPVEGAAVPKWDAGELNAPILFRHTLGSHHAGFLIFGPSLNKPITKITVHCTTTGAAPHVTVSGHANSIIQVHRPIAQVSVTGLQPRTEYVCYYTASNMFGTSMHSDVGAPFTTYSSRW
ncbi:uncharacterized protein LOC135823273 [Sycon ciliatum]|uniref:uncharacterized protein LOC135823273 n=1 Tax=Sycon ciliatum TaxID=27933 RepID=UPI0020AC4244